MAEPPATIDRGGRPSVMDDVLEYRDDGAEVTVAERIIAVVRSGGYVEHAAASAGIDKVTVYEWLRRGARLLRGQERGMVGVAEPTAHDERCAWFAHAVARAEGEFVAEAGARLAAAARGGRVVTSTITRTDAAGNVLEVVTKTEVALPRPEVDQWRLERRFPSLYGRRPLEVSGPEGGAIPVEVRARELADSLRAEVAARPKTPRRKQRKLATVPSPQEGP